jgi:transposase
MVILGVLPDRQKDTMVAFLRAVPLLLCETIHTVCCDMYEGYTEGIRQELPSARIVVDCFHVAGYYHRTAGSLCQQELKRLKEELPPEEYQGLKGRRPSLVCLGTTMCGLIMAIPNEPNAVSTLLELD